MNNEIQSIHFDADHKLIEYINKKLEKMNPFADLIKGSKVYLKLDKNDQRENKIVEIKISVAGSELFCKEQSHKFEAATDLALDKIMSQLIKHKERMQAKNP